MEKQGPYLMARMKLVDSFNNLVQGLKKELEKVSNRLENIINNKVVGFDEIYKILGEIKDSVNEKTFLIAKMTYEQTNKSNENTAWLIVDLLQKYIMQKCIKVTGELNNINDITEKCKKEKEQCKKEVERVLVSVNDYIEDISAKYFNFEEKIKTNLQKKIKYNEINTDDEIFIYKKKRNININDNDINNNSVNENLTNKNVKKKDNKCCEIF